jgi:phosphinothricin acetyltransferase
VTDTDPRSAQIRPVRPEDLPPLVAIYNHYVTESIATFDMHPQSVEDRRGWFEEHAADGPYRLWVAVAADEALLGFASTSRFRPRPGYRTTVESSIYLRPDATGQGLGRRLYQALFDSIADEHEIHRVVAIIALPNPASVALHEAFGFQNAGTLHEVGRKFDRYWDVAHYERTQG